MAKLKTNQAGGVEYVALPAGSVEDGELLDERTDEERAFDEFITGLGAEKMGELRVGKLKLAKDGTPLANARSAHCFSCPIDQYTFSELLEFVRSHYGGGLYRVVGIASGKRGVAFNKIIEIAEDRGPQQPRPQPEQNPANMFDSIARVISESQQRTEALVARLSERSAQQPQPPDPLSMMEKMATMFATIMGVAPKPAAGEDILTQLEKLAKIKELLGNFGGSGDGNGAESNFYDVVKTGLQSFGPALAALAVKNAQTMPQNPALAAPPEQTIIPAPPPTTANYNKPGPAPKGDPAMANFKRQVDTLVMNAKNNVDPAQLAETILDLTPDDKLDDLGKMLDATDMVDKMASLNPEVNNHRPFFEALRKALLDLLEDESADTLAANAGAPPSAPSPGNAATS